jgi:2'-5' RNA ligase
MSTPTLAFKSAVLAPDEAADLVIAEAENIVAGAEAFEGDGVVTAVVSVTGVVDEVDDIIEPGAYAETLRKRMPKVCWHHSWEHPIGKVLWIEELMPGDPRLPAKTRDGQPWPAEAGALVAKMQMNMASERGREAYSAIKFYSESGECEYSIGYKVPSGKSTRDGKGIRHIKVMDLFELSFVLFGAHTMTGTLALKAAVSLMDKATHGLVTLSKKAIDDEFERLMADVDLSDLGEADVQDDETNLEPAPPEPTQVGPDDQAALDISDDEDSEEADLHRAAMDDPEFELHLDAAKAYAMPDPWYGDALQEKRKLSTDQRKKKPTLPGSDTAWPIGDRTDLEAAIQSFGRAKPEDQDKVKRWIIRRARELGATAALPDSWNAKKSLPSDADTDIESVCPGCSDEVVFDTMNGWMRKDGSYSHDDGSTHSDHMPPPPEFKAEGGADQNRGGAENLRHAYLHGKIAIQIGWGTDGDFMRCVDIAGKHMTPEQAKGYCNLRHQDAVGAPPGQGHPEGKAHVYDQSDTTAPDKDQVDPSDDPKLTGVMVALFPDPDAAKKIMVRGGDDPEQLHVTLAYLGKTTDQAGDGLTLEAATSKIVAAVQSAAATYQPLSGTVGGVGKFPDQGEGVPVFALVDVVGLGAVREAVVDALEAGGLPVKTDHGFTPHMTLGYNLDLDLIPDSEPVPVDFTHLVIAVGGTHTRIPLGTDAGADAAGATVPGEPTQGPSVAGEPQQKGYDPMIETGPHAGHKDASSGPAPVAQKGFPRLAGSLEERMSAINRALDDALLGNLDEDARKERYINTDGTWDDRVICTVNHWSGPGEGECESFEFPYTVDDDGNVSLGEPVPVKLKLTAELDGDELDDVPIGDMMPLAELVERAIAGVKMLGPTEIKAGRVLSANNAAQLKNVVGTLLTVLKAAGIEIDNPSDETPVTPTPDMETTAPAARGKSAEIPTQADVAALLASIDTITAE